MCNSHTRACGRERQNEKNERKWWVCTHRAVGMAKSRTSALVFKHEPAAIIRIVIKNMLCWWGKRKARQVRVHRETTVTQMTALYNRIKQKSNSERTIRRTPRRMGYNRRRPKDLVPLLPAENRNPWIQWVKLKSPLSEENFKELMEFLTSE